VKHYLCGLTV